MYNHSEDKCVLCDTFISEMTEAAKYIYGFNQEERMSEKVNCDKLANKLKHALETRWKSVCNIYFKVMFKYIVKQDLACYLPFSSFQFITDMTLYVNKSFRMLSCFWIKITLSRSVIFVVFI